MVGGLTLSIHVYKFHLVIYVVYLYLQLVYFEYCGQLRKNNHGTVLPLFTPYPTMDQLFPEPVCPYANKVEL